MLKVIKILFWLSILGCLATALTILLSYSILKPNLPEISLVDEGALQMPLKIYTEDRVLIGEYGEIKRRPLKFNEIPKDIKNALLQQDWIKDFKIDFRINGNIKIILDTKNPIFIWNEKYYVDSDINTFKGDMNV